MFSACGANCKLSRLIRVGDVMSGSNYDNWPIVEATAPRHVSDDLLEAAIADFSGELRRREDNCVLVLDLRQLDKLSVAQRKRVTEAMTELDRSESLLGCGLVFESRLLRGILTAIFWVHRPRYPTRVFSTATEAKQWAGMIARRGEEMLAALSQGGQIRAVPPSSVPPSHVPEDEDFERTPNQGSWILHSDASRSRNIAAERVGALRATEPEHRAFLAERKLSDELSLWLGWLGPFQRRDDAFAARDDMARRGVVLTVARWQDEPA